MFTKRLLCVMLAQHQITRISSRSELIHRNFYMATMSETGYCLVNTPSKLAVSTYFKIHKIKHKIEILNLKLMLMLNSRHRAMCNLMWPWREGENTNAKI